MGWREGTVDDGGSKERKNVTVHGGSEERKNVTVDAMRDVACTDRHTVELPVGQILQPRE